MLCQLYRGGHLTMVIWEKGTSHHDITDITLKMALNIILGKRGMNLVALTVISYHSPVAQLVVYMTSEQVDGSIPGLASIFFLGLMIVIATGFILLSPLSTVSQMVMWQSNQFLGKNIARNTGKKNWKALIGALVEAT